MAESPELGKMVSMIMENPTLMAELTRMADSAKEESQTIEESQEPIPVISEATPVAPTPSSRREKRRRLMEAIREYLSEPRAKAVDTMMNLFDIIDLAGGR